MPDKPDANKGYLQPSFLCNKKWRYIASYSFYDEEFMIHDGSWSTNTAPRTRIFSTYQCVVAFLKFGNITFGINSSMIITRLCRLGKGNIFSIFKDLHLVFTCAKYVLYASARIFRKIHYILCPRGKKKICYFLLILL